MLYNPYVLLCASARVGDCVWTSAKELGTATTEHQVDSTVQWIGTGDLLHKQQQVGLLSADH